MFVGRPVYVQEQCDKTRGWHPKSGQRPPSSTASPCFSTRSGVAGVVVSFPSCLALIPVRVFRKAACLLVSHSRARRLKGVPSSSQKSWRRSCEGTGCCSGVDLGPAWKDRVFLKDQRPVMTAELIVSPDGLQSCLLRRWD